MNKEDTIINNSFSTGELSYTPFPETIKLDNRISGLYDDQFGDILDYRNKKNLNDILYKIFEKSPYYEKYKNPKRVDKSDMVKMFYYFRDNIEDIKYFSALELFIGFAEFFQVNYDQLYSEIKVVDKENLLKELNDKLSLHNRIKTKKLF